MVEVAGMRRHELGPASIAFKERSCRGQFGAYDRGLESGDPERNCLRLEARFLKKLKVRFGRALFVEDLWDPSFFADLVRAWEREALTVRFERTPVFPPPDATPSVLRKYLARTALAAPGAARVLATIDANREAGLVESRPASDQRVAVRELLEDPALNGPSALGDEVRSAVREAADRTLSALR